MDYGGYPNATSTPSSVSANMWIGGVPGNRGAAAQSGVAERSDQDPDQTSTTIAQYRASTTANGRRIVTAPIDDPTQATGNGNNAQLWVIGFGNFLLDPGATYNGSSGPMCATYIGPASTNGFGSGGTDGTTTYTAVLYQ